MKLIKSLIFACICIAPSLGTIFPISSLLQPAFTKFLSIFSPATTYPPAQTKYFFDKPFTTATGQYAKSFCDVSTYTQNLFGGACNYPKADEDWPFEVNDEMISSRNADAHYELCRDLTNIPEMTGTWFDMDDKLPNCNTSMGRMNKDVIGGMCQASDYSSYKLGGWCLKENNPGDGLQYRGCTVILDPKPKYCQPNPGPRDLSLLIEKILGSSTTTTNTGAPCNMFVIGQYHWMMKDNTQPIEIDVNGASASNDNNFACRMNMFRSSSSDVILIKKDDPDFPGRGCMGISKLQRSNENCTMTKGTWTNKATPMMDCHNLYQLWNQTTRTYQSTQGPGGKILKNPDGTYFVGNKEIKLNLALQVILTFWGTVHDKICDAIRLKRPTLSDNAIFQLVQKIVIGLYQHCFFTEIVPIIFGSSSDCLDPTIDCYTPGTTPCSTHEINICGRVFHNKINDQVYMSDPDTMSTLGLIPLEATYLGKSDYMLKDSFKPLLAGLTRAGCKQDGISKPFQTKWNTKPGQDLGLDGHAMDHYRDYESGVPSYTDYHKSLRNVTITKWEDMTPYLTTEAMRQLPAVYPDCRDVPLLVGLKCEIPFGKALYGIIGSLIAKLQFCNAKCSDPKYYLKIFTPVQIAEIRRVNFNGLISCILGSFLKNVCLPFNPTTNPVTKSSVKDISTLLNLDVF